MARFNSTPRIFKPDYKLWIHILQILLVAVAMILAAVRVFTRDANAPITRTDTIALGMGGKSLVVITYQISTEHISRLRRFASLKANLILNCLEIVFWAAVAFLGIQANTQGCTGTSCYLSWAVVGLAVMLSQVAAYVAAVSFFEFRCSRKRVIKPEISNDSV